MSDTTPGEAGWQPDPSGTHDHRYWDGSQWTDNVSDAGVASTDPYVAAAAAAEPPTPDTAPTDPTVTEPVAVPPTDPTGAFSAGGPPPPVAPVPMAGAPAGDGSGGGGSKKGLLIGGGILVVVAIIVAVLALGGGDDSNSDDDLRDELISVLKAEDQGNLSNADAECVADYLIDNVDNDTLAGLDFSAKNAPDEIQDDLSDAATECNVGGSDSTTTTESNDDSTTTTGFTDDTSDGTDGIGTDIPDAVRDSIVSGLEAAGLSTDQAECVTDKMIDAYQSGDISESDFTTKYLDFFADCDVDPADFGN